MVTIHERIIQWITNKRWSQYMKEPFNGLLTKETFNGLLTKDGLNTWKVHSMDY